MISLIQSLMKRTSLSQGAPELQMYDFLNRILKCMISFIQSLMKRTSLSQGAPELQMYDFLNTILKETDHFEPGNSGAPNV